MSPNSPPGQDLGDIDAFATDDYIDGGLARIRDTALKPIRIKTKFFAADSRSSKPPGTILISNNTFNSPLNSIPNSIPKAYTSVFSETESLHSFAFNASPSILPRSRNKLEQKSVFEKSIRFLKSTLSWFDSPEPTPSRTSSALPSPVSLYTPSSPKNSTISLKSQGARPLPSKLSSIDRINVASIDKINVSIPPSPRQHQHNYATVNTGPSFRILTASDRAVALWGCSMETIVGKSMLEFLCEPHASVFKRKFADVGNKSAVLMCGKVLRVKVNNLPVPVSLWLKLQVDAATQARNLIWVFEKINQDVVMLRVEADGVIVAASNGFSDLFEYELASGVTIQDIIPSLRANSDENHNRAELNVEQLKSLKFFAGKSRLGSTFPVLITTSTTLDLHMESLVLTMKPGANEFGRGPLIDLTITSMPNISGVLIVGSDGLLKSCNPFFFKYLFGYSAKMIQHELPISELIPQACTLIGTLSPRLGKGGVAGHRLCRRILAVSPMSATPVCSPRVMKALEAMLSPTSSASDVGSLNGLSNRGRLLAVHRDSTVLDVDVQIKAVKLEEDIGYALWVSFERNQRTGSDPTVAIPERTNIPPAEATDSATEPTKDIKKGIENYTILDSLGEGAYGFVKIALKDKTKYAIKFVIKSRVLVDSWKRDKDIGLIPSEIQVLHKIKHNPHDNLIKMIEFFEDDVYYYIVMELFGYGIDLFDYIDLKKGMEEEEIRRIFRQCCEAVGHLHKMGIVHRDIKDENIILDEHSNIQLIDFGSATHLRPDKKRFDLFCGTLDYASPEVLMGHPYDGPQQDVWALGILLYTLVYKEVPFLNIDEIIRGEMRTPAFVLSDEITDLIKRILTQSLDDRPTCAQILQHPWFAMSETRAGAYDEDLR